MELGQRLKQARLDAGLSQRQLCGQTITRNMLSQIENGSAKPSMETLRYLAAQLGKPMGYFLEEQAVTSPNQAIMEKARQAFIQGTYAPEFLSAYEGPDPVFDWEYHLLSALGRLQLARQAYAQNKREYALALLAQVAEHGAATPYYTPAQDRQRQILQYALQPDSKPELQLSLEEILLLAGVAADPGAVLEAFPKNDPQWHLAMGDAFFARQDFAKARAHYEKAPQTPQVFQKLEACCRELEDFKNAYYYAKKQN